MVWPTPRASYDEDYFKASELLCLKHEVKEVPQLMDVSPEKSGNDPEWPVFDSGYGGSDSLPFPALLADSPLPEWTSFSPRPTVRDDSIDSWEDPRGSHSPAPVNVFNFDDKLVRILPACPSRNGCSPADNYDPEESGYEIASIDLEESGYREETTSKATILYIVVQFLLLRDYVLNSKSTSTTPSSRPTTSGDSEGSSDNQNEDYSDAADHSGENNRRGAVDISDNNETSSLRNAGQQQKNSSGKRKRNDTGESEDQDDRQRGNKKRRTGNFNSLGYRFACPFAKGNPSQHSSCMVIYRQNLSGVKEHLKRNHFNKKLLPEIFAAKTWEELFLICHPDWDLQAPIPSPYIDTGYPLIQALFASTLSTGNQLNRNEKLRSPGLLQETIEGINNHTSTTSSTQDSRPGREENLETQESSGISTGVGYNPVAPIGQVDFPEAVNSLLASWASPHIPWPPGAESSDHFNSAPDYLMEQFGMDLSLPPADAYHALREGLHMPHFDAALAPSKPMEDWIFSNPHAPRRFSLDGLSKRRSLVPSIESSNSAARFETSIGPSSSSQTSSLTQNLSDVTTPSQCPTSASTCVQNKNGSRNFQYSLIVARRPPIPGSTEGHSPKKFIFENYDSFRARFENWILKTFTDPVFSWETMEFTGADPQADPNMEVRLLNVEEVAMEIEMRHIRTQTSSAVVYLVGKDKGKGRAS